MKLSLIAKSTVAGVVLLAACAGSVSAAGIVDAWSEPSSVGATIELPGGIGAELTVSFESAVGLSPASLGLSAELLDLSGLAAIQSRLPGSLVSVPAAFPVLLTVEPTAGGGLSFSGMATIELYTHDLLYVPGSPLRLFAAPLGGDFVDITGSTGAGSYRVRGHKGKFSEFVIVADLRPLSSVIQGKFARLRGLLYDYETEIDSTVFASLEALLDAADIAYGNGDLETVIGTVEELADAVEDASGAGIPDVWRSSRDLVNVAGELRAAAQTLRFSLLLQANS